MFTFPEMMKKIFIFSSMAGLAMLASCGRDKTDPGLEYAPEMYHSIPLEPYSQILDSTAPFADRMNFQLPPEGSIARGGMPDYLLTDKDTAAQIANMNPLSKSDALMADAEVLYSRYCGVCHGKGGAGDGPVAATDAINPPNFKTDARISKLAPGQIYHVIMLGKGVMGSYASQMNAEERWKVVHYIEKLQGKFDAPAPAPAPADSITR